MCPEKYAWLVSEEAIYLAHVPAERSAITELIERVYHAESLHPVSRARTLLRERIHANYPATLSERETVKVAAKRIQSPTDKPIPGGANVVVLPEAPPAPDFAFEDLKIGAVLDREKIPEILERMKVHTLRNRDRWSSDRAVSAILVDASSRVQAWAWNTNATIRNRHAEWNLCESFARANRGGKIPKGSTLYVSLKPCRMCAARIWEAAENPAALAVVYLENDPGPHAQGTMLDARSPARVRYLGLDHPLFSIATLRTTSA
jgi:tRNA(Arg) A34 adenosine deaminase TadA